MNGDTKTMLPYLVAVGHYKYVSCLPHYLEAMRSLPTLAPNIYREFKDGKFTVHQTEGQFNSVWTDMALEKTYNRDANTKTLHWHQSVASGHGEILGESMEKDKGYGTPGCG